jgi:class 3 adenylate cyclase/tetratricopeptide (TPR) repeat protein
MRFALMDVLTSFIPMDRRQALAAGTTLPGEVTGAVLFADLAGYTALTTALAAVDPADTGDRLRQALAPLFAALVDAVHAYGGAVLGFAGDSATAWFADDPGPRAVSAALAIQAAMPGLPPLRLPDGSAHPLALKIVVTAGPARRFLAGDPAYGLFDVLAGPPLDRAGQGELLAAGGEILLDDSVAAAVAGARPAPDAAPWRTDPEDGTRFQVLTAPLRPAAPAPWPPLPPQALPADPILAWLPAAARPRLTADPTFLSELRPAVPLFLRFSGLDYRRSTAPARLDTYLRWVQTVLARYGGSLLHLSVGDKGNYLYAAFGVPVAYSDSAARAAAAALALRTPPPDCPYIGGVQIGLASGPVYAGPYGSPASATYGAVGPCVNLAARLMQSAGPGSILATRAVRRAAGTRFAWTPLPPLLVKGAAIPVAIYGLVGATTPTDPAARGGAPLVGRAGELAQLRAALARAHAGQGQVLGLIGEAGVGKSRLVAEIVRGAAAAGWAVYAGAAPSYGIDTPYLAWQGIWQAFFDLDPTGPPTEQADDLEERLAELDPALLPRLPLLGPALGLALPDTDLTAGLPTALRTESRVALLIDCLRARAATTPVLLVLEDAHWLDPLSHELLEAVALAIPAVPVAVLLAYRPPELEHLQAVRVEALSHFTALRLGGLATGDAAALVEARLAEADGPIPPPEWIAELVARAGGNPFYLEELVAYAREIGVDLADPAARAAIAWPASLQNLLLARIDQLTEPQRQVLKIASIVGARFPVAHLWGVHPALGARAHVTADLGALAEAELALPEGAGAEPEHRFKHAVTHEVTYGTLPGAVRAGLHGQFAAWLEAVGAAAVEALAYHYGRSPNGPKAREYLRRAGDAAVAGGAFAAAVGHYSALLERLPAGDPERGPVLLARAEARVVLGQWAAAAADYAAARESTAAPAIRAQAARGLGVVHKWQDSYAEAADWLEIARAEYAALGDGAGEARALAELGRVRHLQGDYPAGQAVFNAAAARAAAVDAPGVLALVLNNLGNAAALQGDYAGARGMYEESLRLRRQLGDRQGITNCLHNLALTAASQSAYPAARALYAESLALARELGDRENIAANLNGLGAVAYLQGDYAAAHTLYAESLAVARDLGHRLTIAYGLGSLGNVALAVGDTAAAGTLLAEGLALARELGDAAGIGYCLGNLGKVAHAQGDYPAAQALYAESLALRRALGHRVGITYSLAGLGSVLGALGDSAAARAHLAESLEWALPLGPGEIPQSALVLAADLLAPPEAAAALGAVAAVLAAHGGCLEPLFQQVYDRVVARTQAAPGPVAYAAAFAAGQARPWEEAMIRARAALQDSPEPDATARAESAML